MSTIFSSEFVIAYDCEFANFFMENRYNYILYNYNRIAYFARYVGGHVGLWRHNCKTNVRNGLAVLDHPFKVVLHDTIVSLDHKLNIYQITLAIATILDSENWSSQPSCTILQPSK